MPVNPIVNRRKVDSPFGANDVAGQFGALDTVSGIAATLAVSKASIVDTALRHVASLDHSAIIDLLA